MPRTRKHAPDAWQSAATAAEDRLTENLAAPVVRRSARSRKFQVSLLKWTIIVGTIAAVISMLSVAFGKTPVAPGAAPANSMQVNSSPGKAAATASLLSWLTSTPSPVPEGKVLSWDGFTTLPAPKLTDKQLHSGFTTGFTVEIDHFTLQSTRGNQQPLYTATVEVDIDASGTTTVPSSPTLLPTLAGQTTLAGSGSGNSARAWPGYATVSPPEPVATAVTAWADAYTGTSSDALRQVVGDTDSDHAYLTLSGANNLSATVAAAGTKPDTNGQAPLHPSTIIARVTLSLGWPGKTATDKSHAPQATYDLLITGANSGAPHVVAWGAAGTGPSLQPYQNAIRAALVDAGTNAGSGSTDSSPDTPTPTTGGN